ncbi:calcium/sodium antiporter [Desulfocurvus sp. DL9XJH121]
MLLDLALCAVGFLLLYYGAEWLVKGSSSLARSFGISPVVIGLTVVAFGTSAPELVVSLIASAGGKSMIAVGNAVGSNICNIALVLGISALFQPIVSHPSVVRRDIPIMLGVSVVLLALSLDDTLSRVEGLFLFAGIIAYTLFNYRQARRDAVLAKAASSGVEDGPAPGTRTRMIVLVLAGIAGVVGGANLVVDSAESIMKALGVSEKFIGLTVVAFGTSLPELATSVVAAVRGELDISIGNLVGSNVFNILSVLGAAALVRPIPIPGGFFASGLYVDYLVMLFTSALPWLMMRRDYTVSRRGGAVLLAVYLGYLIYLVTKTLYV